ncbi:EamA family transporter [Amycolatopsis alkalitolerans]|uniref:EamA family transporter n=1 Tax=Amycolatopsis alkalitolerans TaxID=2547244 RepID=UPI001F3668DC|nr:EamA family transporter [Amycolatopsis alkalitolerans]
MTVEARAVAPVSRGSRGRGTVLILISSVCFGTSGPIGKPAMLAGLSPEQVAAARIGLAAVVLLAGVALFRPALLRVRKAELPALVGYGLLAVAAVQLTYFISAQRLPVGIAILLEFTSPVLIALWTRFVRRIRLPRAMWLGIALAMAGLALVAQVWAGLALDPVGFFAGLGGSVCSAAYFLIGEHTAATRDPLGMVTWGMVVGAIVVCAVAPPWTIPASLLGAPASLGPWHPPVWALLVTLTVLSTVLAYAFGMTALRYLPAAVASVIGLLEPVVTIVTGWVLLGESLSWVQLAGALVLLGGATVVQIVHSRRGDQVHPGVGQESPASAP